MFLYNWSNLPFDAAMGFLPKMIDSNDSEVMITSSFTQEIEFTHNGRHLQN